MDIHIQKGTSVSLHSQLVTQISMQITSGLLKPGAKLPSIRSLSQRLGVHHNTCLSAYKELEEVGLIEIRHGSGARVMMLEEDRKADAARRLPDVSELDQLAAFFVRQVTQKGYAWSECLAALEAARKNAGTQARPSLVFVDIHADILPVFQAELEQALGCPVKAVLLDDLKAETARSSHFVVSRYHCQSLKEKLKSLGGEEKDWQERMTIIDVGSGQDELAIIRKLPADSLVVVISASSIILRQAEAVVKALRGEEIYIRTILIDHESAGEVQRVLRRGQAIFTDGLCARRLETITRKPLHIIRVIQDREMEKLKAFRV